jgi:hypothetical protein
MPVRWCSNGPLILRRTVLWKSVSFSCDLMATVNICATYLPWLQAAKAHAYIAGV